MQLFQTEWCPASRRIRQRLTELGIDYVNRQVPVDRGERVELLHAAGAETIPVLILDDGRPLVGGDRILAYLDARYGDPDEAEAHRSRAAIMRRRFLDEECGCAPRGE